MGDLEDRPQHLMLLLALVRSVLGVLHLVRELEQGVFDVVEAIGRRLAVTRGAEGRHVWCCGVRVGSFEVMRRQRSKNAISKCRRKQ